MRMGRQRSAEREHAVTTALPLVVAITGASGAPYAVRLLQSLAAAGQPTWLIVSEHGFRLLQTESGIGRPGAAS